MAGRGDQYIEHGGYTWRTLDGADPQGTDGGCQGTSNYLPLPPGYALAPPNADTIAVITAHGWSTGCAVAAGGGAWGSANYYRAGDRCGSGNYLASSGGSHTVSRGCIGGRVLARCP